MALEKPAMQPADLAGLNVLLVDDDAHIIKIVRTLLLGFGVKEIDEACDAAEAFEKLKVTKFDVIIVDFLMKPLDGLDFIRLVRTAKDSANPSVPIIMLTAFADERRVKEARDAGVNAFLCKPVTASDLHQRLLGVVQRPKPFIRSETYVGPCRRWREEAAYTGPERRNPDAEDDTPPTPR
jgi:CheY-like chemotaxis protein